jgi:predicted outer membrane repeat protein
MLKNIASTTESRIRRMAQFFSLFTAFAFFICAAQSIGAATYTVTTTADSGAGSLRQAVLDANATTANDVIVFNIPAAQCDAMTGVCTITLTNTAGNDEITVSSAGGALTINGTDANRLTISGGAGDDRIFYVNGTTFTLRGVTLTGGGGTGQAFNNVGGAIFASGGTLILRAVHVTGNSSVESGGGVYIHGGSNHQFYNSTFSSNVSTGNSGGAFLTTGGLIVVNTTISGNTANRYGGGFMSIFAAGSTILQNSTVVNNTAQTEKGGGIAVTDNAVLSLSNSIIASNSNAVSPEIYLDFGGTGTSSGYNLIGDSAGDSTATGTSTISYQSTESKTRRRYLTL